MPSVSGKQHRLMELVAHNQSAAKRLGIKQSVGREFVQADHSSGKHFRSPHAKAVAAKIRERHQP